METVTVNLSFRKDLLKAIDEAAKRESRTRSELVREAARNYIYARNNGKDAAVTLYDDENWIDGAPQGTAEIAARYDAKKGGYSYADLLTWPENERWEVIDGVPYDMSPPPSRKHQAISIALAAEFFNYLKGKPCKVYAAPFGVRFPKDGEAEDDKIKNAVEPDLVVVCNRDRLDARGCVGAPDLVVEILSPFTARKDNVKKLNLYEREGVREYWVVRPDEETVAVFRLGEDGRYGRPGMYTAEDSIKVGIFEALIIDLADVFRD